MPHPLAPFKNALLVNLYGILTDSAPHAYSQIPDSDLYSYQFEFKSWSIKDQTIQTRRLEVRAVGSKDEIVALAGFQQRLPKHQVIQIKARLGHDPDGYPVARYEQWLEPIFDDRVLNESPMQPDQPAVSPNSPSIPELMEDVYSWIGEIELKFWDGYSTPQDHGYRMTGASDGTLELDIEKVDEGEPPTPAQIAALRYLLDNQDSISEAILNKIFTSYPEWRVQYSGDLEYMPEISAIDELKNLIRPRFVFITAKEKEEFSYVIVYFDCYWDPEHGFGVTTHKSRILSATISSDTYAAIYEDLGNNPFVGT